MIYFAIGLFVAFTFISIVLCFLWINNLYTRINTLTTTYVQDIKRLNTFHEEQYKLNNQLVKGLEVALDIKQEVKTIPYYGPIGEA